MTPFRFSSEINLWSSLPEIAVTRSLFSPWAAKGRARLVVVKDLPRRDGAGDQDALRVLALVLEPQAGMKGEKRLGHLAVGIVTTICALSAGSSA